jgi:predicted KAP-like P-loop ATPase
MWSDNETEIDLLDFTHLVAAVRSIIADKSLHPATVGIYGDWGSGKSSLMRMMRSEIEKGEDKKTMAIHFNGWLFESYDDAKSALMGTILDEIASKRDLGSKAKELFSKLVRKVDLMRLSVGIGKYVAAHALAGDLGVVLAGVTDIPAVAKVIAEHAKDVSAEDIEKLIKQNDTKQTDVRMAIRDFHQDFNELLKESGIETLVVFIDDLDRCNPETVIDIFEAIRLFLFVPNSVFVIAADEDLMRYAVSTKFPGFQERPGIGRDYLEKLIQYPVKVPPLGKSEIENYIKLLFVNSPKVTKEQFEEIRTTALQRAMSSFQIQCLDYECVRDVMKDVPEEIIEGLTLAETLAPILATSLSGNPRQTKRFLNTLRMRIEMARARGTALDIRVLAKLMLLEYFKTETFKLLAEIQAIQEGKPQILETLEQKRELAGFTHDEPAFSDGEKHDGKKVGHQKIKAREEDPKPEEIVGTPALTEDERSLLEAGQTDDWIKTWLSLEPALSGIDLRPYYYFSRENLTLNVTSIRRMNPEAQKILTDLLHESLVVRRKALDRVGSINLADANSIFSSLAERFRKNDDPKIKEGVLKLMFEFVDKRKDNISQMLIFLKGVPETQIPLVAPVSLVGITRGREEEKTTDALLEEWSKNKLNRNLARAASNELSNKAKRKQ